MRPLSPPHHAHASDQAPRRLSPLSLISALSLALTLSVGCQSEPSRQEIMFKVQALDTNENPVEKVQFFINDDPYMFGKTDKFGVFSDSFDALVGDTLKLKLVPPEGYEIMGESQFFVEVEEGNGEPVLVEFKGTFTPPKHEFLFAVEGKPGEQVFIQNKVVYELSKEGRGLFFYSGSPGQRFVVQVGETTAYQWAFAQTDEVYVVTSSAQHTVLSPQLQAEPVLQQNNATPAELALATPRAPSQERLDLPQIEDERPRKARRSKRSARSSSRDRSTKRRAKRSDVKVQSSRQISAEPKNEGADTIFFDEPTPRPSVKVTPPPPPPPPPPPTSIKVSTPSRASSRQPRSAEDLLGSLSSGSKSPAKPAPPPPPVV